MGPKDERWKFIAGIAGIGVFWGAVSQLALGDHEYPHPGPHGPSCIFELTGGGQLVEPCGICPVGQVHFCKRICDNTGAVVSGQCVCRDPKEDPPDEPNCPPRE